MSTGRTPIALDLAPNLRILMFTAAVSVVTGVLFGLAPAWRATRIDLIPALKNVRNSLTRGLGPGRILAVAQLALSLLLLVGAGLFVRSLQKLYGDEPGIARQSVVILRVEPKGSDQRNIPGTSERLDRTYRELIRRTQEIPGVRFASMANGTPTMPTSSAGASITLPSGEQTRMPLLMVYPDYFATIGMTISSGRDFGHERLGRIRARSLHRQRVIRPSGLRGSGSDREAVLHGSSWAAAQLVADAGARRGGAVLDRRRGQGFAVQQSAG